MSTTSSVMKKKTDSDGCMNIDAQMASPSGSGIFQLTPECIKALEEEKAQAAKSPRASNESRELLQQPFDSWC